MKRLLKYFLAALVVITGVFAQTADAKAFSYTYTVSFSAGGQGSINGGVQVRKASGNGFNPFTLLTRIGTQHQKNH